MINKWQNIINTAQLEFWETYRYEDFAPFFEAVNSVLKTFRKTGVTAETKSTSLDSINNLISNIEIKIFLLQV